MFNQVVTLVLQCDASGCRETITGANQWAMELFAEAEGWLIRRHPHDKKRSLLHWCPKCRAVIERAEAACRS